MAIPTAGLISKWDAFDPACYNPASPSQLTALVGAINIPISGSPVFDATQGSLEFSGSEYAYTAEGTRPFVNFGGSWTISTWVKFQDVSAEQFQIFTLGNRKPTDLNGFGIWMVTSTGAVSYKFWGQAETRTITPDNYLGIDSWNNITVTGNNAFGQVVRVYWNGVLKSTNTTPMTGSPINGDSRLLYSGFPSMPYSNNAVYGPMLIYNQTKNAGEVLDIYNTYFDRLNTPPPSSSVMGGRMFSEGFNG
jgi:hypothetical protein